MIHLISFLHHAAEIYAYSEATFPKITMVLRKAYGGAPNATCSKELRADQLLLWPTAEIAVMGAVWPMKQTVFFMAHPEFFIIGFILIGFILTGTLRKFKTKKTPPSVVGFLFNLYT